jgi:hypothetical protein
VAAPSEYDELLTEYRSPAGPLVSQVHGALIASSIQVLRNAGHFTRYESRLSHAWRERVLGVQTMGFVPLELASAHYEACDALELEAQELAAIGEVLSKRYGETVFGTLLRTSRSAGIEAPWVALRSLGRMWERMFVGGSIFVQRTGPKDIFLEECGNPLSQFRYFKTAHLGWIQSFGAMFVKKLYLRYVRPARTEPFTVAITGSWV